MARWGCVVLALALSCKHGPSHQEYETTRTALHTLPSAVTEPWVQAVDELEREHASTVYVSVFADLTSTHAATEWLKTRAAAYPGATPSTVFPYYAHDGTTPGEGLAVRELTSAFERLVPASVIRFAQDDDKAKGPRVRVTIKVTPTDTFTSPGGHRVYASFDCSYSAAIRLASGETKPFVGDVVATSPDTFTVTRLVFKGDKLPQLGAEPSINEDSLVYTTMIEKCGAEAIPKLVKIMIP